MSYLNKVCNSVILCSVLFLTACGNSQNVQTPSTPQKTQPTPIATTPQENNSELVTTNEVMDEIMPDDQALAAENTRSQTEVQNLITQFAYKSNDGFLNCSYEALTECQNQTANQIGIQQKNADVCDSIMSESQAENCKNQLWNQLAMLESAPALCNNLNEDFSVNNCKNQVAFSAAVTAGDAGVCEPIEDVYQLDECKNQANLTKAVAAEDVSVCETIVMYEYEMVFNEPEITDNGESPDPSNIDPEVIRTAVADKNNFIKQDCINQVQMQKEMAAQEALFAEQEAAVQAEAEANTAADAETEAQIQAENEAAEQAADNLTQNNADIDTDTSVEEESSEDVAPSEDELAPATE